MVPHNPLAYKPRLKTVIEPADADSLQVVCKLASPAGTRAPVATIQCPSVREERRGEPRR